MVKNATSDQETHRFLIRTCVHEGSIIHPKEVPERVVDGRNGAQMLKEYYQWARDNFPDDDKTHHISLGDEIIYYCPQATGLLSKRPADTTYLVGNHEYHLLNENEKKTKISARKAFQKATGSPGTSHFMTFGPIGAVLLNPTYYQEAQLVPGKNMLPENIDLAKKPHHRILRNYIPEQDLDRIILAYKNQTEPISAWIALGHTPPSQKLKNFTGERIAQSKLPKRLICNGTPPLGVIPDKNGEFTLIHTETALKKLQETIGSDTSYIGVFYGDEHPQTLQKHGDAYILPAFSKAADAHGNAIPAQGNVIEVVYKDGKTSVTHHQMVNRAVPQIETHELELVA